MPSLVLILLTQTRGPCTKSPESAWPASLDQILEVQGKLSSNAPHYAPASPGELWKGRCHAPSKKVVVADKT